MVRLSHTVIPLAAVLVAAVVMTLACSGRPVDYSEEDFTDVVERICADYCTMNFDCREPPWFESYEECEDVCLISAYIYNDTNCGQALRDLYECAGSTTTCELYNDTLNVHADDYTCKAQNDYYHSLNCGQSDEDPFPQGTP